MSGVVDGLVDLASRRLGGSVMAASDETFAAKENLILPHRPAFTPGTFGPRGQVYDGWESRRRREPGHDWALVRLGAAGLVHAVEVDTAFFTGNFPAACTVEGCSVDGYPAPADLLADPTLWRPLVARSPLTGDARAALPVEPPRELVSHVRLLIHPDGGVARLRVLGEVVPDPRRLVGLSVDLAALSNGAAVQDCSDRFYSAPQNLLLPGQAATMGEGWETRRRRGGGNDWLVLRLAAAGHVRQAVLDTTHFVGNAPGSARLLACDATGTDQADAASWWELLPRTALQPDTPHWFGTDGTRPATHVRLDIYPDGGLARLRLVGDLAPAGREALARRWWQVLAQPQAEAVLRAAGVSDEQARRQADRVVAAELPAVLRPVLLG